MMQVTIDYGAGTVTAEGHCGYAPEGADIVCAACSALLDTYARCLESIGQLGADSVVDRGYEFLRDTGKQGAWMEYLRTGLEMVAESYPDCVTVSVVG